VRSAAAVLGLALLPLAGLCARAGPARAGDGVAAAEALVRTVWFEGVPYDQARALTPAGVVRLGQMLGDPAEAEYHVNIAVALGMSESPLAYPALERAWLAEPRGEISRAQWRARNALAFALGNLARADRRALVLLERSVERTTAPGWSYRHLRGARLRALLERNAVTALGATGLDETEPILERVARRAARRGDDALVRHVDQARALRGRVAREGAARVFAGSAR
jgi:hypothetical protein